MEFFVEQCVEFYVEEVVGVLGIVDVVFVFKFGFEDVFGCGEDVGFGGVVGEFVVVCFVFGDVYWFFFWYLIVLWVLGCGVGKDKQYLEVVVVWLMEGGNNVDEVLCFVLVDCVVNLVYNRCRWVLGEDGGRNELSIKLVFIFIVLVEEVDLGNG